MFDYFDIVVHSADLNKHENARYGQVRLTNLYIGLDGVTSQKPKTTVAAKTA